MRKFLLVFLVLMATACQPLRPVDSSPRATATNACSTPSDWEITYSRSGGFAFQQYDMTLSSDGKVSVTDGNAQKTFTGTLSEENIASIGKLLGESCPFAPMEKSLCADCFNYSLEVVMNGQLYQFGADDVNLGDSSAVELVGALEGLMREMMK